MAVLNVGALLAARGFRILIIDFDLEAPGLTHLSQDCDQSGATEGVVELLSDAKANGETAALFAKHFENIADKYTFSCSIPSELHPDPAGRLSIMPAGKMDATYAARFDNLDLAEIYQQGLGRELMAHFKKTVALSHLYDYVLIDSRTGHSDEAGICTRDLADHLMIVSGFNRQNIAGTASFLRNFRASLGSKYPIHYGPDIILSPVPIGEEELLGAQEAIAKSEFNAAWGKRLRENLSIPYHPRLALSEDAYVTTRTTSYLKTAYSEVENRLLESLDHRPEKIIEKATRDIQEGKGRDALFAFQRATRLPRPHWKGVTSYRRDPTWHFYSRIREQSQILDQLVSLPEKNKILEILVSFGNFAENLQIAKLFHQRHPAVATFFDALLLKSPNGTPDYLGEYATYLRINNKIDLSESFYKKALIHGSRNWALLANYAIFLWFHRNKPKETEILWKRVLELNPNYFNSLGNYGQFLIGLGRFQEGLELLREAWTCRQNYDETNCEIAYSLWIGTTIINKNENAWERVFKYYISHGFDRNPWNFHAILTRAKKGLPESVYQYAEALAAAFLDESKADHLKSFPRWKRVKSINPIYVQADGTISGANSE